MATFIIWKRKRITSAVNCVASGAVSYCCGTQSNEALTMQLERSRKDPKAHRANRAILDPKVNMEKMAIRAIKVRRATKAYLDRRDHRVTTGPPARRDRRVTGAYLDRKATIRKCREKREHLASMAQSDR